jgi:hypothetical protein
MNWGVWRWLSEKKRVRATADRATDALYDCEDNVKAAWPDELKLAYNQLVDADESRRRKGDGKAALPTVSPEMLALARAVKQADEEAYAARMEAEDIFAEAERKMNIPMAKHGSQRTLESYDLHEKAIRKAEAAARAKL